MRILQVTPYLAPAYAYGGPPVTVSKLSEALAERGNEVTVVTTDAMSSRQRLSEKHTSNGLEIYYCRNLSNYLAWSHQAFLPLGTGSLLRKKAREYDIIHVHMYRTYQNVVVRQTALRAGVPYILSAHGSLPRIVRKQLLKLVFDNVVGTAVIKDAARLVAVSEAEARQYSAIGVPPSKVATIPNGIDLKDFATLPPKGHFVREYGLEGKRLVTYLGRLNSRKGLDTLLDAFRILADGAEDLALVLAGPDDGYRSQIERSMRHHALRAPVVLPGLITMPKKLDILIDSEVVVYPGPYEIFGLVPFEALACGRPVVVANDSGCGEIVSKADAGVTVRPGDSKALSDAIAWCLSGGQEVAAMVRRGNQFVRSELNWLKIAERTEELYADVSSARRSIQSLIV